MSTLGPLDPSDQTCDTAVVDERGTPRRPHLPAGTTVGRYVVQELIGEGGMGAVYKAFDAELSRTIALKLISTDVRRGSVRTGGSQRLLREAQALARLSHPNVLPVYDVGTVGGEVFIATEFVAGRTLRAWVRAGPHATAGVLSVFLAAGQGLAAAHSAGLIHRDFKPDNVMVGDDGRIRVLDFGLVRAARRADGSEPPATPAPATTPSSPSEP